MIFSFFIFDLLFIDYIFQTDKGMYDKEKEKLKDQIKIHTQLYTLEDFKNFTDCFFDYILPGSGGT